MTYEKCKICGRYAFTDTHRCDPAWEVSRYADCDSATVVYARDAQEAVEKYVETHHVDFDYVTDGIELYVRGKGRSLEWVLYDVEVRAVPEAHAVKRALTTNDFFQQGGFYAGAHTEGE